MLALRNLGASYGQYPVLHGLTMTVAAGEVCVVLGPNGAGKSTLLKAIMGLVPVVTGDIAGPGGRALNGLKTHRIVREGVAYVPEGRGILNSLTVRENLQLGAMSTGGSKTAGFSERLDHVLTLFPILREKLAQPAGLLSGGQQQMLAFGRALIPAPRILLLDEPSLGLAPLVRREISDLLVEVVRAGNLAVVLVEQDVVMAERCGTNIHVLRGGHLTEAFSPDALADRERLSGFYLGTAPDIGVGKPEG